MGVRHGAAGDKILCGKDLVFKNVLKDGLLLICHPKLKM